MKVFTSPSSVILMGSILASSTILVACGGGSGDGGSDQPTTTESRGPSTSTPPAVVNGSLTDTGMLPSMPSNHNPLSLVGDPAAISALRTGIYTTTHLNIVGVNSDKIDCPIGSEVICAGIVKYQLDQNNKMNIESWAYMPNSKQWVPLSTKSSAFDDAFSSGNIFSDGTDWHKSSMAFSKIPANILANSLTYNLGHTEFTMVGNVATPTPANNSKMAGVGYSSDAKTFSYRVGVSKGEYITLSKAGFWGKADDGKTYQSLAAFRMAHTQKNQALCLTADHSRQGVVFYPNQVGAQFVKLNGICDIKLDERVAAVNTEEGVKTIAGRQVIYLGQDPQSRSDKNSSESQFLLVLALTDAGTPAQGKAYQKGYVSNVSDEFYNEAAILDWLKAKHGYNANLALPQ